MVEWKQVVDAWQIKRWEEYKDVLRLGRKTRLPESQRKTLWFIFEKVYALLEEQKLMTLSGMLHKLSSYLSNLTHPPFDYVVVDEAQDVSIAQLRFLAARGSVHHKNLFFAGDLGQRIFQMPFSWKAVGIDLRGRSYTLKINYRTSHQIRSKADLLLDAKIDDVDGNEVERKGTISVFDGPDPVIHILDTQEEETQTVSLWMKKRHEEGVKPHEIGIFVRSDHELDRASLAAAAAGFDCKVLDERVETTEGYVSISTMHLAKGLEFRAVVVMACDDEIIPMQQRIEAVGDEADVQEVYDTERRLLYVACTRALDCLLVTSTSPASEFLDDLWIESDK